MKNKIKLLIMLIIAVFSLVGIGYAAEIEQQKMDLPNVAVLYVNNGKTTYDKEIDQSVLGNLAKCIPSNRYNYLSGESYLDKLGQMGITDISTAERGDIIDAFADSAVDYVVFVEVQPFVVRDKFTLFSLGKDVSTVVPLKIIDLTNKKYLYNGKFTEKASASTVFGGLGNKSVALKAIEKINKEIEQVLSTRLPLNKSVFDSTVKK